MRVAIHWQTHDCPSNVTIKTAWGTVRREIGLQGKLLTRVVIAQAAENTDTSRSARTLQVSVVNHADNLRSIYPKGTVHEGN